MMGFSVVFIFALLQICTLYAGGNSSSSISTEDLSNIKSADSSNHHHHLHPRGRFSRDKAEKDEEALDPKNYLEFVESNDPPKDAVVVTDNSNYYYILGSKKCKNRMLDVLRKSDMEKKVANKKVRTFLVNKDHFEIFEWKKWEDIESGRIPFRPLMICKSLLLAIGDKGVISVTKDSLNKNLQSVVYCINNDIKGQHLEINDYLVKEEEKFERVEVLKNFTAHNKNCKSAKHVVKLDQGSDRSRSFLKSRTVTKGGAIEATISGKIPAIVDLGGKLSLKYEQSRLNSETTSNLNKALHSVSVEIDVPPNQSCVIEIKSRACFAQVPFSGQLTRQYNNGKERTTSIKGIYDHYEIAELESFVKPCNSVSDATKC